MRDVLACPTFVRRFEVFIKGGLTLVMVRLFSQDKSEPSRRSMTQKLPSGFVWGFATGEQPRAAHLVTTIPLLSNVLYPTSQLPDRRIA